jgi:phosphoglycerol transferase MdoB-like AlkP superfamily enzyme
MSLIFETTIKTIENNLMNFSTFFRVLISLVLIYFSVAHASDWEFGVKSFFLDQPKLMPVYAVIFLLLPFFTFFQSSLFLSFIIVLLGEVSSTKLAMNGEPLGFYDFLALRQVSQLPSYAPSAIFWLSMGLLLVCVFVIHSAYRNGFRKRNSLKFAFLGGLFSVFSLYPHFVEHKDSPLISQHFFSKFLGLEYVGWHMVTDVRKNGLPFHLIYTSKKRLIQNIPSRETASLALKLKSSMAEEGSKLPLPKKIILVLCEACWDVGAQKGKSSFSSLLENGFTLTEMVSPVFGGGTANAEFEVLTGLPSSKLTGYVYQEYQDELSPQSVTFPSELKRLGYRSYAMHSFHGGFYHRDKIYPKMGFEKFVSLEQMNYEGDEFFPRDSLLYEAAQGVLNTPEEHVFLSAVTVYTHGPYAESEGDGGLNEYEKRLEKSVSDLNDFVKMLDQENSDYLVAVYGDHKPAMAKYFFDKHILPARVFTKTGDTNMDFQIDSENDKNQDLIGKVPVLIKSSAGTRSVEKLVRKIKQKPLYCLTPSLVSWLNMESDPSFYMMSGICESARGGYTSYPNRYPDALYQRNLFRNLSDFAKVDF